jgi:hypothetical protein
MSDSFRIIQRKELRRDAWDALADAWDEAWLWHRYDLQEALECWPGSTDESFALADAEGGQVLALVPLRRITRRLARVLPLQVLESLGGVATRNGLGERRRRELLKAAAALLKKKSRDGICVETRVSLPAMAPAWRGENCPRVNPLLEMGCENALTQTWVVDLRGGTEAVWDRMQGRARTAIRKAERAAVTVREATTADLHIYYRLHQETYRRTGAIPHAKDYFAMIWERFLAHGLARIWVAELDGEPIAAENFGVFKNAAIYWTGAANFKSLGVEANSLLQWTAMQWMIRNGVEWYETGEAFPQFDKGKNKGLSDFKKSFGGSLYPYYKGRLHSGAPWQRAYAYVQGRQ